MIFDENNDGPDGVAALSWQGERTNLAGVC